MKPALKPIPQRSRPKPDELREIDAMVSLMRNPDDEPPEIRYPASYLADVLCAYALGGALASPSYRPRLGTLFPGLFKGIHAGLARAIAANDRDEVIQALSGMGVEIHDDDEVVFEALLARVGELGRERIAEDAAKRVRELGRQSYEASALAGILEAEAAKIRAHLSASTDAREE